MPFLSGLAVGLALLIFIGPVFFTLIQSALQCGFRSGLAVAAGICLSDLVVVLLVHLFGLGAFFSDPAHQFLLGVAGGLILVSMGGYYLLKPRPKTYVEIALKPSDYLKFFLKGFTVNFVNPFVFVVWIYLIGRGSHAYASAAELSWFLAGALLGIFATDTLKAAFAHRIKSLLHPRTLRWVYRSIGLILLGFGLRMCWLAFWPSEKEAPAHLSLPDLTQTDEKR